MSSIADLFARDPLKLTRENRKPIIEHYRANREKFIQGVKPAKEAKPKPTGGSQPSLADLGL